MSKKSHQQHSQIVTSILRDTSGNFRRNRKMEQNTNMIPTCIRQFILQPTASISYLYCLQHPLERALHYFFGNPRFTQPITNSRKFIKLNAYNCLRLPQVQQKRNISFLTFEVDKHSWGFYTSIIILILF